MRVLYFRSMTKLNYKLLAWIAVLAIIGIMTIYVFEITHLSNTLDAGNMVWKSILIGLLIGLVIGKRLLNPYAELVDKIRTWTINLFIPILFLPLIASLTNRIFAIGEVKLTQFEYIEELAFSSSAYGFLKDEKVKPTGCYLFVFHNGEIKRFKQSTCKYWGTKRGEMINLKVARGLWGYDIVIVEQTQND